MGTDSVQTFRFDSNATDGVLERQRGNIVVASVSGSDVVVSAAAAAMDRRVVGVTVDPADASTTRIGNVSFRDDYASTHVDASAVRQRGAQLVWVCDAGGSSIAAGDLVASSAVRGTGMRQPDDVRRSYTVAKCLTSHTFTTADELCVASDNSTFRRALLMCAVG
jgi:hypothetical protein